jgi:hypothetical protein
MRLLVLQVMPVRHRIRVVAMNVQPRDRFRESTSVEKAALGTGRSVQVYEARLQREDLMQPFDIAPGYRQ